MPLVDPEARRAYYREYQKRRFCENPEARAKHIALVRKNDEARMLLVEEIIAKFRQAGCFFCHETSDCCLAAHHRDPYKKLFSVGNAKRMKKSLDEVTAELSKCVCLCFNCHCKVHAGLLSL